MTIVQSVDRDASSVSASFPNAFSSPTAAAQMQQATAASAAGKQTEG